MTCVIEERFRPDGVACYFFKRNGTVLHSGYTDGKAVQVRRVNIPCKEGLANAE
jgi:hypothetical protein